MPDNHPIGVPAARALAEPLRLGVAGLGVSFALLAQHLRDSEHLRLVAGCDPRAEARNRFLMDFGGRTYTDFSALCADPNVEAIYLMTPNPLHCEQAVLAASHGKHVIVDKPFALSLAECDRMIEAADRNDVLLTCGATHSLDPGVRTLRQLVSSGEFGQFRMANSWNFNDWAYRSRAAWELKPDGGGNVVFNQGSHQIDIVRLIGGGMLRSIRASTAIWDPARPVEGAYSAFLEFDSGATATLAFSAYAHFDSAELTGWVGEVMRRPDDNIRTRQRFVASQSGPDESALKDQARYGGADMVRPEFPPLSIYGYTLVSCDRADLCQTPEGVAIYGDQHRRIAPVPSFPGYSVAALENLYEAARFGAPLLRGGAWSKATIEVTLAMLQSAAERREIRLQHQVPSPE